MLLRPRRARAAVLALLAAAPLSVGLLVLPVAGPSALADEPSAAPTSSPAPDDPDPDDPKPTPTRSSGPPKLPSLPSPSPSSPTPEPDDSERPTAKPKRTAAPATTAPKRRRTPAPTAADHDDDRDDVAPAAPPAVEGRDWSLRDDPMPSPGSVRPTDVALAGTRTTSDQLQGVVGAVIAGAVVLGVAGGAGLWLTREGA